MPRRGAPLPPSRGYCVVPLPIPPGCISVLRTGRVVKVCPGLHRQRRNGCNLFPAERTNTAGVPAPPDRVRGSGCIF